MHKFNLANNIIEICINMQPNNAKDYAKLFILQDIKI